MKRKVLSCVNTGRKTKDGKEVFEVMLDGDEKCTSFGDDLTPYIGREIDLEIKATGRFYNGVEQKYVNIKKDKNYDGNVKNKNRYTRQVALTLAVETMKSLPITETNGIIELAERYLEWLNK